MSWTDTLTRIALALVLIFPIGLERERGHKPAGLRTHMLVGIGCCLFTLVSIQMAGNGEARGDPGRIAAQVVTGIGFLGGGAILRAGGAIRGLTTAASIWSVAAIGMACGVGFIPGAVAGTFVTFIVLTLLERWELRMMRGQQRVGLRIHLRGEEALRHTREMIEGFGVSVDAMRVESVNGTTILVVQGAFSQKAVGLIFQELFREPGVLRLEREEG